MSTHSRVAAIVMAMAVALIASGCVGEEPAPNPTPTATSSPTPVATTSLSPTPTPTPEAEDAYDPADMATWEISYSGIGPVLLDRPVAEVLAEVAAGEETCRPGIASFFGSAVVGVGDGADPALISVASTGPSPRVDVAARPHTDAGITAGSTFDDLLRAYPNAEAFTDSNGRPGYHLTDGTSWIHFTSVDGQTINIIDVSRDAIDLKEYCG